jgi:hypothetical protein
VIITERITWGPYAIPRCQYYTAQEATRTTNETIVEQEKRINVASNKRHRRLYHTGDEGGDV